MSTITKEQIEQYANAARLIQVSDFDKGKLITIAPEHMLDLARIALASLELERGMIRRFDLDMSDCDSCGQDCGADMVEDLDGEYVLWDEVLRHLYRYDEYTAPPATVSVPAAYEHTEDFSEYHEGWNACRAAMLQGAEPVTTDTVQGIDMRDADRFEVERLQEIISGSRLVATESKLLARFMLDAKQVLAAPQQEVKP